MSRHPMSPVDAAWLHMDGPANPAVITGILLTRRPMDFGKVRTLYRERLLEFDRFRQRVVEPAIPFTVPQWEDVENFDIDQHMRHVALPAPHDERALQALLADVASIPLDPGMPLWQVIVVDGVGAGGALIMRCHHCIADGSAMMTVIGRMFDAAPAARSRPGGRKVPAPPSGGSAPGDWLASAFDTVADTLRSAIDVTLHPGALVERAADVAGGAGVLLRELVKPADPPSPFKGEFVRRQQVSWSQPVAIADVKSIGQRHGAKVNDVLVAAMAGALRHYLMGRGVDVAHTTLRAMVPVDLRPPQRRGELGNEFGLVILELPVTASRRAQRLAQTKSRMDALKSSPEAAAMLVLMDIFGRGPKALEDVANDIFGSKASVVLTNVAGPREQLYVVGVPIERFMFWVPHPGRQLGMGISIMSYHGLAWLTVIADARLVPDPDAITRQFNREFEVLLRGVRRAQ